MFISNISAHVQNVAQKAKTDPKSKLIQSVQKQSTMGRIDWTQDTGEDNKDVVD